MYEDAVEELKGLAEARGLRVEEGDGQNEFALFRGDEYLESVWYLEAYDAWTSTEPGSESLDSVLEWVAPKKQPVRRELEYLIAYSYGRRRAPDHCPEGAVEALLDTAVKMAKKLAPGATKVWVTQTGGGRKSRSLV